MDLIELMRDQPDILYTGEPATKELIEFEQNQLGTNFSKDYIEYISNLGIIAFDGKELTGISPDYRLDVMKATLKARDIYTKIGNEFYVLEFLDINGLIVLQKESGEVFLCDMACNLKKICDSLSEYITR